MIELPLAPPASGKFPWKFEKIEKKYTSSIKKNYSKFSKFLKYFFYFLSEFFDAFKSFFKKFGNSLVSQKELSKKSILNKISCPYTENNKKDMLRVRSKRKKKLLCKKNWIL
jgi:hypothetical protein